MLRITHIKWDVTDGAEEMSPEDIDGVLSTLPTIIVIDNTDLKKYDITENCTDEEELNDAISDYLSDEYGFLHDGFTVDYDFEPTVVKLVECSDHNVVYGAVKLENVTFKEVQDEIYKIKNDPYFLDEYPDWTIKDVFAEFPKNWKCELINIDSVAMLEI